MRKLDIQVEALIHVPVKIVLNLSIRAEDDANLDVVMRKFAKGVWQGAKADVEDVEVESAKIISDYEDDDESLESHIQNILESGGKKLTLTSEGVVTESR